MRSVYRIPGILSCWLLSAAFAPYIGSPAQPHPRDHEIHDADTLAWWHTTEALSNDAMEGRDTGSAAYQRAADYVAARFKAADWKLRAKTADFSNRFQCTRSRLFPKGPALRSAVRRLEYGA